MFYSWHAYFFANLYCYSSIKPILIYLLFMFMFCLFSVYEYGSLQNNIMYKTLGKNVLLFSQYNSTCWHESIELFVFEQENKIVLCLHGTLFYACNFISLKNEYPIRLNFLTFRTMLYLKLKRNTRYGNQDDFIDKALLF